MGDNTPPGMGYPAGIQKRFKIDAYKDTSSFGGRWLIQPDAPKRVGATIQTAYYFGPGQFEVGMKPLQDFGATTTIWAYHYNEFYPNTPDPLQRHATATYHDPQFIENCFIQANDTATSPNANCSCPLNSFPAHPWQQKQMGEYDHWWAANSEIDIEFPTPASNADLSKGYANMMRFNTWKGQCGTQYTYSFQVVKTLDDKGNIVNVTETPGFHDGLFHVWRFDWYNQPAEGYGPTRIEFYIDGVLQRNVSHMNPDDSDPRVRESEWEFLNLMPTRPMRLWIGVWFSYWGTASPAQCLTPDDTTDPFSRPCAPWGDASDPENPSNPVWREALIDYVKITPVIGYGTALWEPELYVHDALAISEYPYALPYANPNSGLLPKNSETGLNEDFSSGAFDNLRWLASQSNTSPREQTVWGQMCHGNICKGSPDNIKGTRVIQTTGGFDPSNVVANGHTGNLELHVRGDLYNGPVMGRDEIGGLRTDGKKVGAAVKTAQYYGPGKYTIKLALAPGPAVRHNIYLSSAAAWEETSPQYKAHCSNAKYMPTNSDCRTNCLLPGGWPKGTGYWQENNWAGISLPYHPNGRPQTPNYSFQYAHVGNAIGICEMGSGLGSNGTSLPANSPEFTSYIPTDVISGNPFTNSDGSRRFIEVELEWHTWLNDTCARHMSWSVDGKVVYETGCDDASQGLVPVTAMRLNIEAGIDVNAGIPWFDDQSVLLDSVVITQFDEPTDRLVESYAFEGVAQPETIGTTTTVAQSAAVRTIPAKTATALRG